MTAPRSSDAIVVGAGIVGAACAAALARDGWRVTVIEKAFAASGTTAAGMGHLVAMDDSPDQLALTAYSEQLWRALESDLDPRSELEHSGTLWIAEDDSQLDALAAKCKAYEAAGVANEILDPRALADAEPRLRHGLAGALRVVDDSVVYPPAVTLSLLEMARQHGARVLEGREVTGLVANGVLLHDGRLRADVVVNAGGAFAAALTPGLPIVPRKGHLAITDRMPGFCRHQLVELGYLASAHVMTSESVAFNVQPRRTGQVLVGSSRELVGWDASINRRILARMLERAMDFLPSLSRAPVIRCWTGFRPATPDKLPLIGRWEPTPGLWIAAGHEGLGITTSLATGQLIADQVAGRATAIPCEAFAPMRAMSAEHV